MTSRQFHQAGFFPPPAPSPSAHTCHWPGCPKEVPPALWGCKDHWHKLPERLRTALWNSYVPGQEMTKTPSREYLEVADEVQRWCRQYIADGGR